MSTAELKSYLHQLIVETNDTSILKKVRDYFKSLQKVNSSDIIIPESHKKLVRERIKNSKHSDLLVWDNVKKDFDGI